MNVFSNYYTESLELWVREYYATREARRKASSMDEYTQITTKLDGIKLLANLWKQLAERRDSDGSGNKN